jgi:chromatin assembly factor 1 subunit B
MSGSMRPSSPTRSNSTSSVATQSSLANPPGTVISNPPLVAGGSVPGIAAAGSSSTGSGLGVSGVNITTGVMPMTTPPQTPRSATSSVSGIKRDASESEKEDGLMGGEKKRRRIAPTLVGDEGGGSAQ